MGENGRDVARRIEREEVKRLMVHMSAPFALVGVGPETIREAFEELQSEQPGADVEMALSGWANYLELVGQIVKATGRM